MSELPLAGVRVLDLSRLLPGGFCSLLLADFGADVLKVEDTGMGDYIRLSPPYYEGAEDSAKSALFLALNRNKRSIRVDLKQERGREVLLRLVREYDVVLESFRPGVLERLGVAATLPPRAYRGPKVAQMLIRLLNDPTVTDRCRLLAKRIGENNGVEKLCQSIESLAEESGIPLK